MQKESTSANRKTHPTAAIADRGKRPCLQPRSSSLPSTASSSVRAQPCSAHRRFDDSCSRTPNAFDVNSRRPTDQCHPSSSLLVTVHAAWSPSLVTVHAVVPRRRRHPRRPRVQRLCRAGNILLQLKHPHPCSTVSTASNLYDGGVDTLPRLTSVSMGSVVCSRFLYHTWALQLALYCTLLSVQHSVCGSSYV